MYLRANKKFSKDMSLQEIIGTDSEGNEVKVEDKIAMEGYTIEDAVDLQIQSKALYKKIESTLKDREKTVIELRYGLGNCEEMTQREIAEQLNISRSYISRIEKKALFKLNKELS